MAKKRRNNPQTALKRTDKPAENKAQEKAPVEAGTVIEQLFGSLESEPDIENDIASLGGEEPSEEESIPEKKHKNGFFFGFAVFIIVMAIIGCVSTVRFIANFTGSLLDNTSLKNEFAQFIFPVVVNDIAPFESVTEIPNSTKITCGIWNILINKDTSQYEKTGGGVLTIPEYDVTAACKEIFGSNASIEHQTAGTAENRFTYDEDNHVYIASKNTRYLTYSPTIVSMSESGGTYTLIVGYLPPSLASVAGISGMEASPEKYMEYTINRWDNKDTLMSVRFTEYVPEGAD